LTVLAVSVSPAIDIATRIKSTAIWSGIAAVTAAHTDVFIANTVVAAVDAAAHVPDIASLA
jgi:hypothetical protein